MKSKIREENLSLTHLEGEGNEDEDSEFDRFAYESGDGEEIDDDSGKKPFEWFRSLFDKDRFVFSFGAQNIKFQHELNKL